MLEDRIEGRLDELRRLGKDLADARALRFHLEHSRKAVIAMAMKTAESKGHTTAAAQEREAYASAEYDTWLRGATEAVREAERLGLEWDVIDKRFRAWQSVQATERAEMQFT